MSRQQSYTWFDLRQKERLVFILLLVLASMVSARDDVLYRQQERHHHQHRQQQQEMRTSATALQSWLLDQVRDALTSGAVISSVTHYSMGQSNHPETASGSIIVTDIAMEQQQQQQQRIEQEGKSKRPTADKARERQFQNTKSSSNYPRLKKTTLSSVVLTWTEDNDEDDVINSLVGENRKNRNDHHDDDDDGARLLSWSLWKVSSSLGLAASSLRVSGETVGGVMGASVKLVGKAIKSSGNILDTLGNKVKAIQGDGDNEEEEIDGKEGIYGSNSIAETKKRSRTVPSFPQQQSRTVTSPSPSSSPSSRYLHYRYEQERHIDQNSKYRKNSKRRESSSSRLSQKSRNVLAKSIHLVGSLVGGVGDSLLWVGTGAEQISAKAAGLAEDSVRILQDVAQTMAQSLHPTTATSENDDEDNHSYHEGYQKMTTMTRTTTTTQKTSGYDSNNRRRQQQKRQDGSSESREQSCSREGSSHENTAFVPTTTPRSLVTFGTYEEKQQQPTSNRQESSHHLDGMHPPELTMEQFISTLEATASHCMQEVQSLLNRTAALFDETDGIPNMTMELLFVFLALYFLTMYTYRTTKQGQSNIGGSVSVPSIEYNEMYAKLEAQRRELAEAQLPLLVRTRLWVVRGMKKAVVMPVQYVSGTLLGILRFFWNPRLVMFVAYGFVWFHVARLVQRRSLALKQHAESIGYREALVSLEKSHQTFVESSLWLNQFISHIWQTGRQVGQCPPSDYLQFVQRGMNGGNDCIKTVGWRRHRRSCADCVVYRGFEPHLSQNIGLLFTSVLEAYQKRRPHDVAYASLHSLTLGHKPPIIQSIESLGAIKGGGESKRQFRVELFVPSEVNLVLDMKLSSLHYAMLPSTRIAVSSLGTQLDLLLTTKAGGVMPFVSDLEVSLLKYPDVNLRIMPVSDDSGLRGIDIGAFPLIREWIKEAVRETISEYVSPKFISIDIFEWFDTGSSCQPPPGSRPPSSPRLPKVALIRPKNPIAKLALEMWLATTTDED